MEIKPTRTHRELEKTIKELECEVQRLEQVEEALGESESRFRDLLENANDLVQSVGPDGSFIYVNHAWLEALGYNETEVATLNLMNVIHPESLSHCMENFQNLIKGENVGRIEATFRTKNGKSIIVEGSVNCRMDEGEMIFTRSIFRDITEQKKAEETNKRSLAELNQIFNLAADGMRVIDLDGNILRINNTLLKMFQLDREQTVGRKCYTFPGGPICNTPDCPIQRILRGEERVETEVDFSGKNGQKISSILTAIPFLDSNGELIGIIEDIKDITPRKEAERALNKSLEEKKILLREVHHRVKNNMQVISSLLYVQSGIIKDESARNQFEEARNRIQSMALAHDNLYLSEDISKVDIQSYVKRLVADNMRIYGVDEDRIVCDINIPEVRLPIDQAIPCGLIINELLTNSLKYAFPDNHRGKITIVLQRYGNKELELTVKDNGIGLPEDLVIEKHKTFGLMLVSVLTEQLFGTVHIEKSNGTCVRVKFQE